MTALKSLTDQRLTALTLSDGQVIRARTTVVASGAHQMQLFHPRRQKGHSLASGIAAANQRNLLALAQPGFNGG
ncbi:hypothetical protein NKH16_19395 [Mesorhizobium sp. M1307]|uniref:hypothetical protein n=1 Tax=Mesorhizobium sp. M1307 TaxID=2957079 RepID=UPI003336F892